MKNITIGLILGILILGAGYLFVEKSGTGNRAKTSSIVGVVSSVNTDAIAYDGPSLITLTDNSGISHVIAIPSMGLPLCAAFDNIASVGVINVGDMISVNGEKDADGNIVPCSDANHFLSVTSRVTNTDLGYEFTLKKGPDGYVILKDTEKHGSNFVSGSILFNRDEYQLFTESTEARDGPPAISIRVYKNDQNLSASVWAMRNPRESNVELVMGDQKETAVSGANAITYTADGLYPTDTYIIANAGKIYVLMGAYLEKNSKMHKDFKELVNSFKFIQTQDQM
jgi:hypothetical protein